VFVVDTNVLLYAADTNSEFHAPCRRLLEDARASSSPWFLTWGIVYEFLRVATHPRVYARPRSAAEAHAFVEALLGAPNARPLTPTDRHAQVLRQCLTDVPAARGNLVHDLHTAVLMREHGIGRIVTHDRDFHQFPWLAVVDPLRV